MKLPRQQQLIALILSITLPIIGSASAYAATTRLTLTVTSSTAPPPPAALVIAAPASVSLGTNVTFPSTYTTPFPSSVTVTDTRLTNIGWISTVLVSALTQVLGATIPASVFSYNPGTVTKNSGTGTLTGTAAAIPGIASTVVVATLVTADVSASWTPTLTLTEADAPATGDYTGTVTSSVF